MNHSSYSPDLIPSNKNLFGPGMKHLVGHKFKPDFEVKEATRA
jgi:hypothetical protein